MTSRFDGYRQEGYARSLREFGRPLPLPSAGGWLLERAIPSLPDHCDAIGCYPVLACRNWDGLPADLEDLHDELVTIAFVADPFAPIDPVQMARTFDVFTPFKEHMILDLSLPPETVITKHHRYYARRALRSVEVDITTNPQLHAREWTALYEHLVERHHIEGLRSFSAESFEEQLALDGMVMLRAIENGETVAAHLWLRQDDVAYSHLAASTPRGYELSASYALYDRAIRHFAAEAAWMNFGSGAGLSGAANDGLSQFKRGWASGTRVAHFCGKILQPDTYRALAGDAEPGFFPAYRAPL